MRLFWLIFRILSMAVVTDKTAKMMSICPSSKPTWNEKSGNAMDDSLPNIERRKLENPSPWMRPKANTVGRTDFSVNTYFPGFSRGHKCWMHEKAMVTGIIVSIQDEGNRTTFNTLNANEIACPMVNADTNQTHRLSPKVKTQHSASRNSMWSYPCQSRMCNRPISNQNVKSSKCWVTLSRAKKRKVWVERGICWVELTSGDTLESSDFCAAISLCRPLFTRPLFCSNNRYAPLFCWGYRN